MIEMAEISLKLAPTLDPYEAYLLPVSGFPIPKEELGLIDSFLRDFGGLAIDRLRLSNEVFLQLEQMETDEPRHVVAANGKDWMPEPGLGVWVDREPPRKWTWEEVTATLPGEKMRALMFQVFRISTSDEARVRARSAMLRYGSILEIFVPNRDSYLEKVKPLYMEGITDPSYTCFPYYVGLIEGKTMANANLEQLHRWFRDMTVYVRQSFEDRAVLIASATPLAGIFEKLGGLRHEGEWTFPQ